MYGIVHNIKLNLKKKMSISSFKFLKFYFLQHLCYSTV